MPEYVVRSLTRADELVQLMGLQELVCGQVPDYQLRYHTLIDIARNGGQILGAFDGQQIVGFLVAFLGTDSRDPHRPAMANLKLSLSRLAVQPEYRGVGLATQMMLRLRDIMIKQGIRLLTYAFDPLSSREAYLLIRKLGVIAKALRPDYYGMNGDGPTDRLVAQWWVTHNRVEERLFGKRKALTLGHYLEADTPIVNPARWQANQAVPFSERVSIPSRPLLLVEIPVEAGKLAYQWQFHIRDALLVLTEYGYVVTDFLIESYEGRQHAFYVLSFDGPRLTITV